MNIQKNITMLRFSNKYSKFCFFFQFGFQMIKIHCDKNYNLFLKIFKIFTQLGFFEKNNYFFSFFLQYGCQKSRLAMGVAK